MPADAWRSRNGLLNEFLSALDYRTDGRLSHLSLDVVGGALFIEAISASYYAVQLTLAATRSFWADGPMPWTIKLSFLVDGHPLVLLIPNEKSFAINQNAVHPTRANAREQQKRLSTFAVG